MRLWMVLVNLFYQATLLREGRIRWGWILESLLELGGLMIWRNLAMWRLNLFSLCLTGAMEVIRKTIRSPSSYLASK